MRRRPFFRNPYWARIRTLKPSCWQPTMLRFSYVWKIVLAARSASLFFYCSITSVSVRFDGSFPAGHEAQLKDSRTARVKKKPHSQAIEPGHKEKAQLDCSGWFEWHMGLRSVVGNTSQTLVFSYMKVGASILRLGCQMSFKISVYQLNF